MGENKDAFVHLNNYIQQVLLATGVFVYLILLYVNYNIDH